MSSPGAVRAQVFAETVTGQTDHRIGRRQNRLGTAVVLLERHHSGRWAEVAGKIEDIAHIGGAKAVDRLGIVADDGETGAVGLETEEDGGLQRIGVLIFIDQHMIEQRTHPRRQFGYLHELAPVQEQVVIVEYALALLGCDVAVEQFAELRFPFRAPGKPFQQHRFQRLVGVDGPRIDGETGGLEGKAPVLLRKSALVSHQVHEVGGVFTIMNGERGIKPDAVSVTAQQTRRHRVKRSCPANADAVGPDGRLDDAFGAPFHFGGRAPGESQQ